MDQEVNMVRVAQCPICHANVYCCIVKVFTEPRYGCLKESEEKTIQEYQDAGYEIKDVEHATPGACECYTPKGYARLIRFTLEAAAERAQRWLLNSSSTGLPLDLLANPEIIKLRLRQSIELAETILEPLNKEPK